MLNNVKSQFSIKDLENLTGIKAHTIRIWEKRYKILTPSRTETNIRYYDLENLKNVLSVTTLYNSGHKISKIANLTPEERNKEIKGINTPEIQYCDAYNNFKLAMINFDYKLFDDTYSELLKTTSFENLFVNTFVPLLESIGLEWQSNVLNPMHEHFISELILQKLHINIEKVQHNQTVDTNSTFILFLPMGEIHDIGITYIHYHLLSKGYKSIYLGPNVPLSDLKIFTDYNPKVELVSYFTVSPNNEEVQSYIEEINNDLLQNKITKTHILGQQVNSLETKKVPKKIITYSHISEFLSKY